MNNILEYIEIDGFNCMMQLKQTYQKTDNKAIAFIMKKDIWGENEAKSKKDDIISFLEGLEELLILVLDCECCESTIEFLFAFDLCLATESVTLSKLKNKEESSSIIHFILGKKCLDNLYELEIISHKELLKFGFINKIVSSITLKNEIEDYVIPMIIEKSKVQISSIKTCFRAYKQAVFEDKDIYEDRMKSGSQETEQFCKLSLIKFKELEKNYVS